MSAHGARAAERLVSADVPARNTALSPDAIDFQATLNRAHEFAGFPDEEDTLQGDENEDPLVERALVNIPDVVDTQGSSWDRHIFFSYRSQRFHFLSNTYLSLLSPFASVVSQLGVAPGSVCAVCGSSHKLVKCHRCMLGFHMKCIDPSVTHPTNPWFCNACSAVKHADTTEAWNLETPPPQLPPPSSGFPRLIADVRDGNPIDFILNATLYDYYVAECGEDWLRCCNCKQLIIPSDGVLSESVRVPFQCKFAFWLDVDIRRCSAPLQLKGNPESIALVSEYNRQRSRRRNALFYHCFGAEGEWEEEEEMDRTHENDRVQRKEIVTERSPDKFTAMEMTTGAENGTGCIIVVDDGDDEDGTNVIPDFSPETRHVAPAIGNQGPHAAGTGGSKSKPSAAVGSREASKKRLREDPQPSLADEGDFDISFGNPLDATVIGEHGRQVDRDQDMHITHAMDGIKMSKRSGEERKSMADAPKAKTQDQPVPSQAQRGQRLQGISADDPQYTQLGITNIEPVKDPERGGRQQQGPGNVDASKNDSDQIRTVAPENMPGSNRDDMEGKLAGTMDGRFIPPFRGILKEEDVPDVKPERRGVPSELDSRDLEQEIFQFIASSDFDEEVQDFLTDLALAEEDGMRKQYHAYQRLYLGFRHSERALKRQTARFAKKWMLKHDSKVESKEQVVASGGPASIIADIPVSQLGEQRDPTHRPVDIEIKAQSDDVLRRLNGEARETAERLRGVQTQAQVGRDGIPEGLPRSIELIRQLESKYMSEVNELGSALPNAPRAEQSCENDRTRQQC